MFSKATRFEPLAQTKCIQKNATKTKNTKPGCRPVITLPKTKQAVSKTSSKPNPDSQSQCGSSVKSTKSFVTPKPLKKSCEIYKKITKNTPSATGSVKKNTDVKSKIQDELIKSHEVEIRNKDQSIDEYIKQIEDLKHVIAGLNKKLDQNQNVDLDKIDHKLSLLKLNNDKEKSSHDVVQCEEVINDLKIKIDCLTHQCKQLEEEVNGKQVELSSLEDIITIRDSLCKDLQKKLTDTESCLEETRQRLEMVKGHHALALEANESIRREYKAELETLKSRFDDEKQAILNKSKSDQDNLKLKYNTVIETIKNELTKEKEEKVYELQQLLTLKDQEMKAKLEQIDEATHEKLKLCEIQFEERSRNLQEHWVQQQNEIKCLEAEIQGLKYTQSISEEKHKLLQREINNLEAECDSLRSEKDKLIKELHDTKEESKMKMIDFENQINKLTVEIDKATKEKNKFEMSLSVTRDIVQVLTMRLRESDNELEHLENQVKTLSNSKDVLESELITYKNSLNNTILECNEYKEALVNILKSKAALAKEHNRIMEHNVSLIESLQNVEKEAYRELGSIKNELIEDVELLKKESSSQIKLLKEEVEKKRQLCEAAREQAGQAAAAAEQSRALLAHAAADLARLEGDNRRLLHQIQDQQSLVVELSLLRQENEELTMTIAKQSSVIDKMKKDAEQIQVKPKSPSVFRKTPKMGKENVQNIVSPLRERNH